MMELMIHLEMQIAWFLPIRSKNGIKSVMQEKLQTATAWQNVLFQKVSILPPTEGFLV